MKIKLEVSAARCEALERELTALGIDIDDDAPLVLRERNAYPDILTVRDAATNERVRLPVCDIITAEAFGHDVEVFTSSGRYLALSRLYQLQAELDPERFLRISNSVIVARAHIQRISPALSMKFTLTLSDKRRVDVTRSFYYTFKEYMGI